MSVCQVIRGGRNYLPGVLDGYPLSARVLYMKFSSACRGSLNGPCVEIKAR
jgi:hypothetical protein